MRYVGISGKSMAWTGIIVGAATGGLVALCAYPFVNKFIRNETAKRWTYLLIFFLTLSLSREFLQPPIERYFAAQNLEEDLLKNPAFSALKEFEPTIYAGFINDTKVAMQNGEKESSFYARASAMLTPLVLKRVPVASNAAALEYMKVTIQEVEFVFNKGGDLCYSALMPEPGSTLMPLADIPTALRAADNLALAEVLRSARLQPQQVPTEDDFGKATEPAHAFFRTNGVELEALNGKKVTMVARRRVCEISIDLYKELFKLPPNQAGIAMRYLISAAV